jgi:hypothetical protein
MIDERVVSKRGSAEERRLMDRVSRMYRGQFLVLRRASGYDWQIIESRESEVMALGRPHTAILLRLLSLAPLVGSAGFLPPCHFP